MNKNYMVVETTNLTGSVCFDLQSNEDIQNGSIVGKGELLTNETCIYTALNDYSNGMYLVSTPAWNYITHKTTDFNEENVMVKRFCNSTV